MYVFIHDTMTHDCTMAKLDTHTINMSVTNVSGEGTHETSSI